MATVAMLLARSDANPDGDTAERINMAVTLTPQGRIDEQAYQNDPEPWILTRYGQDGPPCSGRIVKLAAGWAFLQADKEDEPLWVFDVNVVRPGEYVTFRDPAGAELIFRVVEVQQT